MAEQNDDKTHDATPYRRQQAREEGQVARSQDLASALILLGALLILRMLGQQMSVVLRAHFEQQLSSASIAPLELQDASHLLWQLGVSLAPVVLPMLLLMAALAWLAHVMQVGFLFLPKKIAFNLSHIDPLQGLRRVFSPSSAVRLLFGMLKIATVLVVAGLGLWVQSDEILSCAELATPRLAAYLLDVMFWTGIHIGGTLLALAVLDYGFQYWKHERDLRMTDQELRDEMKTLQGNPQVIARRRAVQRQLVMNRLNTIVPTADFVVTNPTELAVAIRYDFETMAAPVVVAKGAGVLAQRIRRLALEHHIPIIERKEVARALYQQVEVNQPIPTEQYAAVAEILRYVYQLQNRKLPGAA